MSKIVALVCLLIAAALFLVPTLSPGDYECAECDSAADCGGELQCVPFSDGQHRCARDKWMCREGELDTGGTWTHMVGVAVLAVGALAFSVDRARNSSRR